MVFAGSAIQGFDCKDIEEIIRKAKAKEMFVVVDTYGEFLSAALQAGIDFLKIKRKEFIAKFDSNNKQSFRSTQGFVKIFKKEKIKEVAITFDKEGAFFYKSGLSWCGKI
jgi:fructose-1-phosphate kinase PfkB-like protein